MRRKLSLLLSILAPFAILTAGHVPQSAAAATQTLVVAIGADATFLDPESVMNNESGFVMSPIFDGLTKYKKGTSEPGPGLAEKWDVSPDGKKYTFHLRRGVKFHDGTPWNADAAIAEIDRVTNKNNEHYVYKQQGVHSFAKFTWGLVSGKEKIDDHTIQITLSEPHAPFLSSLAMVWSGIVSPASVKQYGFGINDHPVGTGPFKLVEWVRNDHLTLEANKDYWGGAPKIGKLIFRVVPESSVRLLKLEQGEIQIMADVNPDDYPRIKSNRDLALLEQAGLTVSGLTLPNDAKPFDDVRVRRALNYAVNKDEMNKFLYKDAAVTAATGMPPILAGFPKDLKPYPFDPEKAKQLLGEAGYPKGFESKLLCYENPRGYNPVGIKQAVAIQEYLSAVGVKLNLETLEWGAFLAKRRSADNKDMGMVGWSGDNGDPDNFLYEMFSTDTIPVGNTAHYSNKDLDKIMRQARTVVDPAERAKLYEQASTIIHDDAPWLFINHTLHVRATRANVSGFALNPLQMFWYMEDVDLK
ncbi:MAG: ABC transporter substrate-binding protein [Desulfobacteraceae bacterium]|nr:MAG: ABC transporter substrate-binding protein [Desulfobacteraceae bacterium]